MQLGRVIVQHYTLLVHDAFDQELDQAASKAGNDVVRFRITPRVRPTEGGSLKAQ